MSGGGRSPNSSPLILCFQEARKAQLENHEPEEEEEEEMETEEKETGGSGNMGRWPHPGVGVGRKAGRQDLSPVSLFLCR